MQIEIFGNLIHLNVTFIIEYQIIEYQIIWQIIDYNRLYMRSVRQGTYMRMSLKKMLNCQSRINRIISLQSSTTKVVMATVSSFSFCLYI